MFMWRNISGAGGIISAGSVAASAASADNQWRNNITTGKYRSVKEKL